MRVLRLLFVASLLLTAATACGQAERAAQEPAAEATAAVVQEAAGDDSGVNLVVAPAVQGDVDEALVLQAYRRAVEQGERDFGIRPARTVTIYIDPDRAIGLEDALGLSARYAIHLRAGRAKRMDTLMPLMMHEYTHVLQYQTGRLRPQWWIEGQAEHEAQRVVDPGRAAQNLTGLRRQLAADVRGGRAPDLAQLRGSNAWDQYIKRSGAGKAYGWGQAAVSYIEDGWGFDAVRRIFADTTGQNMLSSFDEAVRRETGLDLSEFESGLRDWLQKS